jgi:predicted HD phosphohydrolase
MDSQEDRAHFHDMSQSTQEDWQIIMRHNIPFSQDGGRRILDHLKLLDGDFGGFAVDRLTHSLQTATRAHRDGRDEDYVVMALLHDIGEKLLWIVQHHGIFQGQNFFHHLGLDRDMREQFRGHEWFADTEEFIDKYDCPSFDPECDTLPLSFFEPMVMKFFRSPLNSIYKRATEAVA